MNSKVNVPASAKADPVYIVIQSVLDQLNTLMGWGGRGGRTAISEITEPEITVHKQYYTMTDNIKELQ